MGGLPPSGRRGERAAKHRPNLLLDANRGGRLQLWALRLLALSEEAHRLGRPLFSGRLLRGDWHESLDPGHHLRSARLGGRREPLGAGPLLRPTDGLLGGGVRLSLCELRGHPRLHEGQRRRGVRDHPRALGEWGACRGVDACRLRGLLRDSGGVGDGRPAALRHPEPGRTLALLLGVERAPSGRLLYPREGVFPPAPLFVGIPLRARHGLQEKSLLAVRPAHGTR